MRMIIKWNQLVSSIWFDISAERFWDWRRTISNLTWLVRESFSDWQFSPRRMNADLFLNVNKPTYFWFRPTVSQHRVREQTKEILPYVHEQRRSFNSIHWCVEETKEQIVIRWHQLQHDKIWLDRKFSVIEMQAIL